MESRSLVSLSDVSMRSSGGDPSILQLWSSSVRTMWPFWVIPNGFDVRCLPDVG